MPAITVFPDPIRAYNRVEVNWGDQPAVDYARVLRVDSVTGQCTPLRPYICFDGDYLNMSCDGHGIFWDTEVPLDRSVYYVTEALSGAACIPPSPIAADAFNRVVAPGSWGSADVGGPWTQSGGVGTDYFVNGIRGVHSHSTVNAFRQSMLAGAVLDNGTVECDLTCIALPSGAPVDIGIVGRFQNVNHFYIGEARFETTGAITARIRTNIGGVFTTVASVTTPLTFAGTGGRVRIKFAMVGPNLWVRLWDPSFAEPITWNATAVNTAFTTGEVGLRSILNAGSTNVLPAQVQYDNFIAHDGCEPCVVVTADTSATPTTMPSNGAFRLKDPVRPCNDLYVPLCFDQAADPSCLPGSGVFFANMDTESYESNTLLLAPTNASSPLAMNRVRRTKASVLQLVTRTFADRDDLLKINHAGSPLLFQGPPNYGIPDAYLSIGRVEVARGLTDHRFPVRINNLPFNAVARPSGPTQGVCGSRVADLCDFTFAELAADGNTWEDLVRGRPTGTLTGYRTWDGVLADFADWNAVNDGTRTFTGLEVGD